MIKISEHKNIITFILQLTGAMLMDGQQHFNDVIITYFIADYVNILFLII